MRHTLSWQWSFVPNWERRNLEFICCRADTKRCAIFSLCGDTINQMLGYKHSINLLFSQNTGYILYDMTFTRREYHYLLNIWEKSRIHHCYHTAPLHKNTERHTAHTIVSWLNPNHNGIYVITWLSWICHTESYLQFYLCRYHPLSSKPVFKLSSLFLTYVQPITKIASNIVEIRSNIAKPSLSIFA